MKVGNRLAQLLVTSGVEYVFGVPGGQTLQLYEGIMNSDGSISHVLMRDERSAGFAADAYARMTRKMGVCDATVGPGATNLLSPLAEAYCSSIPILAIISDIPRAWEHRRHRGNASQAIRQVDMFSTVSKWQVTLNDPESLDDIFAHALRVANSGRPGPVVLSIPEDVFTHDMESPPTFASCVRAGFPLYRCAPDPASITRAIDVLKTSTRPALLVGGGAHTSGAYSEIKELAVRLQAPVATTITGKGIIEEVHPLSIGVAGSVACPVTNEIMKEADLVVFIGTKTGQVATYGYEIPSVDIATIHVDVDPEEMGRNYGNSLPVVGDARLSVRELITALGDGPVAASWDVESFSNRLGQWYSEDGSGTGSGGAPLNPRHIMKCVGEFITDDDVIVCDASLSSGWAAVHCRLGTAGRRYMAPRGLAGLGWGLPAAIGASLAAAPEARIIVFAGDGGFAYSVQELEVAVRLRLPVIVVLFNNDVLGWIKHVEKRRFSDGYISTDFSHIDFAVVARGFGARGYNVKTIRELSDVLATERNPSGPAVIDVISGQWETPVLRSMSKGGG